MNPQKQVQKNPVPSKPQSLPKPQEQKAISLQTGYEALREIQKQEEENKAALWKVGKIALTVGGVLVILVSLPAVLAWLTKLLNSAKETQTAWRNWKK